MIKKAVAHSDIESLPGSIAPHRGRATPSGSAFYAFGNKEVINIGGNYVTGDEDPGAHIAVKSLRK